MMRRNVARNVAWTLLGIGLWTAACRAPLGGAAEREADSVLTVMAASSLYEPFTALGRQWRADPARPPLRFHFASSQHLVLQLIQGAPGDVLASAHRAQVERALAAGLADAASVAPFAANSLVLVVHPAAPVPVEGLADLTRPGLRLGWARAGVPLNDYTERALARWSAAQPEAGYAARVKANVLSHDAHARSVFQRLAQGEADAAILYATDALSAPAGWRVIPIDPAFNVRAQLYAMPVNTSARPAAAAAFVAYLLSAEGQAVLRRFGFETDGRE